jgi:hypothetical protein
MLAALDKNGDEFTLEVNIPLPDPKRGALSTQLMKISNFNKTNLNTFEFSNMSSFNLKVASESFNELVQTEIEFLMTSHGKTIARAGLLWNKLFLADSYEIDEHIPLVQH